MPSVEPVKKADRKEPYWKELNKVIDPEINLGVVDLGLIYDVKIDKNHDAIVYMSLTSPSCPYAPMLISQVEDRMRLYNDINDVRVQIVWSPVWNQEMIDPDLKELLFDL